MFLWHFPWGRPPWPLASTLPRGARTFLPPCCHGRRPSDLLWRVHQYSPRQITAAAAAGSPEELAFCASDRRPSTGAVRRGRRGEDLLEEVAEELADRAR